MNYDCVSNVESDYFSCYSENDNSVSVKTMEIALVALGIGIGLSVKKMDSEFNVLDESFLSEYNLQRNEMFECNEREENGSKVQILKQELTGVNGSRMYTKLTKTHKKMELETFSSFGGVTTKQVLMMDSKI